MNVMDFNSSMTAPTESVGKSATVEKPPTTNMFRNASNIRNSSGSRNSQAEHCQVSRNSTEEHYRNKDNIMDFNTIQQHDRQNQ